VVSTGSVDFEQQRPEVILGVDIHKDVHVAAVLSPLGALLDTGSFEAKAAGYQSLVEWSGQYGVVRRAGLHHRCRGPALVCREGGWSGNCTIRVIPAVDGHLRSSRQADR
jgi:hypothetical protein